MARRKCVLRACPHHHYALDRIGGTRIKPHPFPKSNIKVWREWQNFVIHHNGSFDEPKSEHFICSAHFLPHYFHKWDTLKLGSVPTIAPEVVREIAIKNGDVSHPRPYNLPLKTDVRIKTIKSDKQEDEKTSRIIVLEEVKRKAPEEQHSHSYAGVFTPQNHRRKDIGDLSLSDFVNSEKSKVAVQLVNDTLLKIWSGQGVISKEGCSKAVRGSEIEVFEKCSGGCYGHAK